MNIQVGDSVAHRTLHSRATVQRTMTHQSLDSMGNLRPLPVIEVTITDRAPRSHHKDGDSVIWAAADVHS